MKTAGKFACLVLSLVVFNSIFANSIQQRFEKFIHNVKKEAITKGVSQQTVDKYLSNLKAPTPRHNRVIRDLHHQAQKVLTFEEYFNQLASKEKIAKAQRLYKEHYNLLMQVYQRYEVAPQIIVAIWGIESDFGKDTGDFSLIHSLAILAFQQHRSAFYRLELISALKMLDHKIVIPEQLKSSFDGGMGQTQFEPTAYLTYAVDFNHDGFPNIWTDLPDVFASIANYLRLNGWKKDQTWGMEVKLPKNFDVKRATIHKQYPISYWKKLGVKQLNGKELPSIKGSTSILLPSGIEGPAYLALPNFFVLLTWNHTIFEGLSLGLLANKIP